MNKEIRYYFHLYIGCMVQYTGMANPRKLTFAWAGSLLETDAWKNVKFILRRLDSMTEEDACIIAKILISPHAIYHISKPEWCLESAKYWAKHGLIAVFSSNAFSTLEAFNYLRSKGYDCDGLIDANLALDREKL